MIAILFLIGIGVTAFVMDGLSDDSDDSTQTFTDDADFVFSEDHRDAIETRAAEDPGSLLAESVFLDDALNVDTGDGDDDVIGSKQDDILSTGDGEDLVYGDEGDDVIDLGDGNDRSGFGLGPENAALRIGLIEEFGDLEAGDDEIYGRKGDDYISDFEGSNIIAGNEGADYLVSVDLEDDGSVNPDTVLGGWGQDFIVVDEGDTVTTGVGNDDVFVSLFGDSVSDGSYDPVEITDFVVGEDALALYNSNDLLFPNDGTDPVTLRDMPGNTGTSVLINGVEVVRLPGAFGLVRADIALS